MVAGEHHKTGGEAVQQVSQTDPAPIAHELGKIQVQCDWKWLAVDVTHYRGQLYLLMMDCEPGRVTIWRELHAENAEEISQVINEIFLERGPVEGARGLLR